MTCFYSHDGASYVLGALSPEERHRFEEHLPTCPTCTATVQEFSGMPGLLARISSEEAANAGADAEPPPPSLLPRLLTQVHRERRSARWRVVAVAAAAAAVVGVGGAAIISSVDDHPAGHPSVSAVTSRLFTMKAVNGAPVQATVRLTDKAWGTAIDMRCTYSGDESGSGGGWGGGGVQYVLVATDRNGHHQQLATWKALPEKTVKVPTAVAMPRSQLSSVQVTTGSGEVVANLAL